MYRDEWSIIYDRLFPEVDITCVYNRRDVTQKTERDYNFPRVCEQLHCTRFIAHRSDIAKLERPICDFMAKLLVFPSSNFTQRGSRKILQNYVIPISFAQVGETVILSSHCLIVSLYSSSDAPKKTAISHHDSQRGGGGRSEGGREARESRGIREPRRSIEAAKMAPGRFGDFCQSRKSEPQCSGSGVGRTSIIHRD